MKTLLWTLLCVALALNVPSSVLAQDSGKGTPPGLKKKGGVPPGLQKKGGLPPGQAKKHGQNPVTEGKDAPLEDKPKELEVGEQKETVSEDAVEKRAEEAAGRRVPSPSHQTDALETGQEDVVEPLRPTRRVSREMRHKQIRLQAVINAINELSKNPAARSAILRGMTRKNRLTEDEINAQLVAYPNAGLGDLYAANHVAVKSRQPLPHILSQHRAGLNWGEVVTEHRADLPRLLENSNELEEAARRASSRRR